MDAKKFSALELDAIGEVLNISLGSSATALSNLLNARVDITTPVVKVVTEDEFHLGNVDPAVGVEITYVEGLSGQNVMLLKRSDVKAIVETLMYTEIADEDFELNEMNISAVCEVMNQMMGASATALSEFLGKIVNISTPVAFEIKNENELKQKYFAENKSMVTVGFNLRIGDKVESEFINVMPTELAKTLVSAFIPDDMFDDSPSEPEPAPAPTAPPEPVSSGSDGGKALSQAEIEALISGGVPSEPAPAPAPASSGKSLSQEEIEALLAGGGADSPAPPPAPAVPAQPAMPQSMPMPQSAPMIMQPDPMMQQQLLQQQQLMNQMMQQLQSLQQQIASAPHEPKQIHTRPVNHTQLEEKVVVSEEQQENLELIMGVPLEVTVEIGRTKRLVKEILEYTKGSLVVLDKLAGEQVDLYVNGQCIAKGDVVVVDDNFGVRVTEILRKPEL